MILCQQLKSLVSGEWLNIIVCDSAIKCLHFSDMEKSYDEIGNNKSKTLS